MHCLAHLSGFVLENVFDAETSGCARFLPVVLLRRLIKVRTALRVHNDLAIGTLHLILDYRVPHHLLQQPPLLVVDLTLMVHINIAAVTVALGLRLYRHRLPLGLLEHSS